MKFYISYLIIFLTGITLLGCSSASSKKRELYLTEPTKQLSLFDSDTKLTEKGIANSLNYHFKLPKKVRIAIYYQGNDSLYGFRNSSIEKLGILPEFIKELRSSERILDASLLPSLIVPTVKNLDGLRIAASKFQADLIFVFSEKCDVYNKYNIFSKNDSKSFCSVDSVLFDTRSGIIPFTNFAVETYDTKEKKTNRSYSEMIRRRKLKAIKKAMLNIAKDLNTFVEKTPISTENVVIF